MAKKPYHHRDLANALIEAALPLLARKGAAELSLREVAKATGVSQAAPYRHFRNKAALLEAIAVSGFRELSKACEEAERRFPADPVKQLTEAGMGYLFFAVAKTEITHLMFGGAIDLDHCGDVLKAASRSAYESLVRIVAKGQQAGVFREGNAGELTLAAWSTVHGLAMLMAAGLMGDMKSSKKKIRDVGNLVSGILYSGMLRR